jgi:hypothetical protein
MFRNFHVPITIKTLRTLNLLLLLSKTSLSLAKKIDHQTWPNILPNITFQTLHNVFKRRSMEAFLGCHFLIIEIIGLTISSAFHVVVFPTTLDHYLCTWQRCQNMEGLIYGKCGKMCSITTKFRRGGKKTLNAFEIFVWK